jgi:hypothetical protein
VVHSEYRCDQAYTYVYKSFVYAEPSEVGTNQLNTELKTPSS